MSHAKKIIKSFITEADDQKVASLTKSIETLANKSDHFEEQAAKEYKTNGRTKKFYQLRIEVEKANIELAKKKLERYKAKGGEDSDPFVKKVNDAMKDSQEMIKDFTRMSKGASENFHEAIDGEYLKKWDALSDKAQKLMNQANAEDDKNGATKKHFQLRAESKKAHIEQDKVMIAYLKSLDGDKSKQIAHYQEQIKKLEAQVKEEMKRASEAEK